MPSEWIAVARFDSEEEAVLALGFLRSRAVPAEIESTRFRQEPVKFGLLGGIVVRVPPGREREALDLLAEVDVLGSGDEDASVVGDQ